MRTMHKRAGRVEFQHMGVVFNHYHLSQSHYAPLILLTAMSITMTHDANGSANEKKIDIAYQRV